MVDNETKTAEETTPASTDEKETTEEVKTQTGDEKETGTTEAKKDDEEKGDESGAVHQNTDVPPKPKSDSDIVDPRKVRRERMKRKKDAISA
jgi:hypothetical protein